MCGIFGYIGPRKDAAEIVFEGLKQLEYRGYDSWGVAVVPKDGLTKIGIKKKAGKIGGSTVKDLPNGSFSFGHTRWATHGGVTDRNAHPHLDCTGNIAVVHNGIFENYEEIKKKLIKRGHKFVSETDTEVLAHLVEDLNKKVNFAEAVRIAFNQMDGLNAIIAINTKDRTFVAVKNGSPLCIGFGIGENFLASDAAAFISHTKNVHFFEDDELAIIEQEKVTIINARTKNPVRPKIQRLNWKISQAKKGNFPHFMIKEIYEQPSVLTNILNNFDGQVRKLAKEIKNAEKVFLVGCGSAHYVAMTSRYLLSQVSAKHVDAVPGSEFEYFEKFVDKKGYVVFFSQSGESIDIVQPASKLQKRGIPFAGVTNRLGSALYRMAKCKILLNAGPEICVLSTKSFTAKLAVMLLTSHELAKKLAEGKKILKSSIEETTRLLSPTYYKKYIKPLVEKLKNKRHIYMIGRGASFPITLESALKIKEASYIHAEGFAGGELKHGVIALIEKGSPCIVYAPDDESYSAIISNAMEIKSRGGYMIGISSKPNDVFDWYLPVKDSGVGNIIPNAVIGQLLGYHITVARHIDPDMPRNLAKSVTVK